MENAMAVTIIKLIKESSYTLEDVEKMSLSIIEQIVDEGVDLPPQESLELENLFEKIKRGGYLNV